MSEKKKLSKIVTPAAVAAFAWLHRPDEGQKYSNGKFKVSLILDDDHEFIDTLKTACKEAAKAEWGKVPADLKLPIQVKEGKEEFEGKVLLPMSSKFAPGIVDAKRQELAEGVEARSGDLIKASVLLYPYESTEKVREGKKTVTVTVRGISLQLRNVQLLEKRTGSGGAADDFEDEDDYEAPKARAGKTASKAADADDDNGDDNGDF
jgi:hypothetical protein